MNSWRRKNSQIQPNKHVYAVVFFKNKIHKILHRRDPPSTLQLMHNGCHCTKWLLLITRVLKWKAPCEWNVPPWLTDTIPVSMPTERRRVSGLKDMQVQEAVGEGAGSLHHVKFSSLHHGPNSIPILHILDFDSRFSSAVAVHLFLSPLQYRKLGEIKTQTTFVKKKVGKHLHFESKLKREMLIEPRSHMPLEPRAQPALHCTTLWQNPQVSTAQWNPPSNVH